MSSSHSTRTYTVTRSKEENASITLTLAAPTIHAENLYLQTWASGFVLANLLHKLGDQLPLNTPRTAAEDPENAMTIDILELGAGTGLVGLSAASIFRSSLSPNGKVVLTDLPTIVPALVENIKLNEELVGGRTVLSGTLDWNAPNQLVLFCSDADAPAITLTPTNEGDKALVIVAADTMYTEYHPLLLSQTIFTWLRKVPEARAVICYVMRIAYLDAIREFWRVMESGGMVCVKEGREVLGEGMVGKEKEEWDDEQLHEWSIWRWKCSHF